MSQDQNQGNSGNNPGSNQNQNSGNTNSGQRQESGNMNSGQNMGSGSSQSGNRGQYSGTESSGQNQGGSLKPGQGGSGMQGENQNLTRGSSASQEDISDQSGQSSRASNVAGTNDLGNDETLNTGSRGAKYGTDSDEDKANRNNDFGSMVNTRAGASGSANETEDFQEGQHRSESDEYKNQSPSDKNQSSSDKDKKNNW